jgi:hypothetical protein
MCLANILVNNKADDNIMFEIGFCLYSPLSIIIFCISLKLFFFQIIGTNAPNYILFLLTMSFPQTKNIRNIKRVASAFCHSTPKE